MGACSNFFADYKPKYFSRHDKSAKSTYFRKIASYSYKFYKYLYMERGEISSELMSEKISSCFCKSDDSYQVKHFGDYNPEDFNKL